MPDRRRRDLDNLQKPLLMHSPKQVSGWMILRSLITVLLKWHTEFGHLNRGDMLTSEQHRCSNEKKKF